MTDAERAENEMLLRACGWIPTADDKSAWLHDDHGHRSFGEALERLTTDSVLALASKKWPGVVELADCCAAFDPLRVVWNCTIGTILTKADTPLAAVRAGVVEALRKEAGDA